jgi:transposase
LEVAHIKLAASRAFLLVAYFTQTHEMLFDAHARGFAVFGGVPKRGIYDNMNNLREDLHLQECARAGRTIKKARQVPGL